MRARLLIPPIHRIHVFGEMNKIETDFASTLEYRKRAGEIIEYKFEALTFRLCHNVLDKRNSMTYTPDFLVVTKNEFELYEIKGFWREDARLKIKIAAEIYPWYKWFGVTRTKKEWKIEEF